VSARRTTRRAAGVVAAVLLPVALAGCSGLRGTGDLDYVPGEGNVVQVPPDEREAPVEVSGDTVDGGTLDLADSRGKVTVVNVWWSGCQPCRSEMPMLVDAAAQTADIATFAGINIRDTSRERVTAFEEATGVDYPSIYDGSAALLQFGGYQPQYMPSTVVLDREGRVAALINGAIPSEQTLTDVVEEVAAEDG